MLKILVRTIRLRRSSIPKEQTAATMLTQRRATTTGIKSRLRRLRLLPEPTTTTARLLVSNNYDYCRPTTTATIRSLLTATTKSQLQRLRPLQSQLQQRADYCGVASNYHDCREGQLQRPTTAEPATKTTTTTAEPSCSSAALRANHTRATTGSSLRTTTTTTTTPEGQQHLRPAGR